MRGARLGVGAVLWAASLAGQGRDPGAAGALARTGVVFETYSLGSGLAFDRISELVVPLTVAHRFGSRLTVDLATAYASASVRTIGGEIRLDGMADTDVRAAFALVPARAIVTLVGTLPTGIESVADTTLPLYGATATDLFGFTLPSFGGGGAVSLGVATAFPLGRAWAVGTAASYRHSGTYTPVAGGEELSPGGEGRVRVGVEGPLGGGTYFRGAVVFSRSGPDEFSGGQQAIAGDRLLAYASINLPLGRGALSLWAWEMRRLRARGYNTTYAAAVQVPRGNVLALGARLDRPLSPAVSVAPTLEFRHELSGTNELVLLGYLVRPGLHVRWRPGGRVALAANAQFAFGQLRDEGVTVRVSGPRAGLLLDWTP